MVCESARALGHADRRIGQIIALGMLERPE
jgi:hypothetical protein